MTIFGKLFRDGRGVGTIEYALVAMLIAVGAISAYANLGTKVEVHWFSTYSTITAHLG